MSLINEALKKAQSDRPAGPKHLVASQLGVPGHSHPAPRKKNYLWGFLMSVIIVGLFSAGISTFLVYYILGSEKSSPAEVEAQPNLVMEAPAETSAETPPPAPVPEAPAPATAKVPEQTVAKESVPVVMDEPVAAAQTITKAPQPSLQPPAVSPPPQGQPNPAVWTRLEQFEIRGILGGGTKVLVFDLSTGKTKSFVEGDLVDGPLGLQIVALNSNAIVFKDYGGFQYNKSF
ncbi:MAG TPA: hypothetical protein VK995_04410 [Oceanipulchritudo sp.]|nr:hypothetical protein [Oceanipulchritudo sp.]